MNMDDLFDDMMKSLTNASDFAEREVAQYNQDSLFVDTCRVNDGKKPYETAVAFPLYNDGSMVIVEAYDTKEEAQAGHDKWVNIMLTCPPDKLVDCQNGSIPFLCDDDAVYPASD